MAEWFVRPDTSHSGTRDGKTYDQAWGGWLAIVWGGAGVVGGDTLYICGSHASASTLTIGAHGATTGNPAIISGGYPADPGSITFSGASFLNSGRSYTTIEDLTITAGTSNCFYINGVLAEIIIQSCTLNIASSAAGINLSGGTGLSYTDITIDGNTFTGGSSYTLGAAINWLVTQSSGAVSLLTRVSITNNTFESCVSARSIVGLRIENGANASAKMADITFRGNTFTDCVGLAVEIYREDGYGTQTGVKVLENTIYNQQPVGILGGGFAVSGFGPSLTDGFGANVIARNEGYVINGPVGLINVFYGSYLVYDNYGEDISTHTIDGNGLLFDHGCDGCVAYGNEFQRLTGKDGVENSGCGIMVLDATNISAYGNIVDGCRVGLYYGNKAAGQSSNIHNNTLLNCSSRAVDILATADMAANLARNNIFTGASESAASVFVASGTWTGESSNVFRGFGIPIGHTLHATDLDDDPQLDSDYRPQSEACKRTGTYLGGKDFNGKHFYDPPNLGGVDDLTTTPRYGFKSTQAA